MIIHSFDFCSYGISILERAIYNCVDVLLKFEEEFRILPEQFLSALL